MQKIIQLLVIKSFLNYYFLILYLLITGKVVGYFYDSSGKPTSSMKNVQESIKKALKVKEEEKSFDLKMPACNSMSSQEHGSKVWCSKKRFI